MDLAFGGYQMDNQPGEARTHRCQRSPFYHQEFQEIQLSCQSHFADAAAGSFAELAAEGAMQKLTTPEDGRFRLQRTRCFYLASGPSAGSVAVGIVHPKPPNHVASTFVAL